jgi:hypothetical protein
MVGKSKIRRDQATILGGGCCVEAGKPTAIVSKLGHGEEALQFDQGKGGKGRANPHKYKNLSPLEYFLSNCKQWGPSILYK